MNLILTLQSSQTNFVNPPFFPIKNPTTVVGNTNLALIFFAQFYIFNFLVQ